MHCCGLQNHSLVIARAVVSRVSFLQAILAIVRVPPSVCVHVRSVLLLITATSSLSKMSAAAAPGGQATQWGCGPPDVAATATSQITASAQLTSCSFLFSVSRWHCLEQLCSYCGLAQLHPRLSPGVVDNGAVCVCVRGSSSPFVVLPPALVSVPSDRP